MAVQTPTQTKPFSPQLRGFLSALEASGATERTREAHRSAVERLGEFMAPRAAEFAMPSDLRGFLSYLGELGVSQQSQTVYRAVLVKWMEHLAMPTPGAEIADDGEATGILDYSKEPDPVDDEQTWPLRRRKQAAEAQAAEAQAARAEAAQAQAAGEAVTGSPVAAMSADFGSAFDAAATAARQAETIVMTAWADDGTLEEPEVLSWDDARVAARPAESAVVGRAYEPLDPPVAAASTPRDIFEFAASVPPAPAPLAPVVAVVAPAEFAQPMAAPVVQAPAFDPFAGHVATPVAAPVEAPAFAAPALPPSSPAAFGFGAESGDLGDSTMLLTLPSSGLDMALPATEPTAPPVPLAPTVELPAFLRAPAMPTARSADQDAFDSGFTQTPPPTPTPVQGGKGARKSIGLSTAPADTSFGALSDADAPAPPPRVARMNEDTLEGWGLRGGAGEKRDLSLAQIRNMALAGTITARTMVKRPGGEWMPAGQFTPLRAVFASLAETPRGATSERDRATAAQVEPLPPVLAMMLAWGGALAGAVVAGMGWWLAALVAGQEVVPLAALGGLFGGFAATWLSRTEGKTAAIPGAVAGAVAPLIGRYLLFLTLKSGVVTLGATTAAPSALAFIEGGMTPAFGIGVAASVLLGLLLGFVGAGRTR